MIYDSLHVFEYFESKCDFSSEMVAKISSGYKQTQTTVQVQYEPLPPVLKLHSSCKYAVFHALITVGTMKYHQFIGWKLV